MIFRDRIEAGRKLAGALAARVGDIDVVVGLPKGGVICASEVAGVLQKPLAIVLVKKIRHPHAPDYAVGAIADKDIIIKKCEASVVDSNWLEEEVDKQKNAMIKEKSLFLANRPNVSFRGKKVLIIDDSLAAGVIMLAAIEYVNKHEPKQVHVAVPVSASVALSELGERVHTKITLYDDPAFTSVRNYYERNDDISDEQILKILQKNG